MTRRFCARCGKRSERLIGALCRECYLEHEVSVELPKRLRGYVCRECKAVLKQGRWERSGSPEEAVEEAGFAAVSQGLRVRGLSRPEVGIAFIEARRSSPRDYLAKYRLEVKGSAGGERVELSQEVEVRVRLSLCESCQRRASRYYEAVLQIRGHAPLTERERKELSELVRREVEARRGEDRAFISSLEERREGIDFYIGSAKLAKQIASLLVAKYGGTLKTSTKLVGVDESGRSVLRYTYAYRLPRVKRGDVVRINNKVCQVLRLSRGSVSLLDLATRRSFSLPEKQLARAEILAGAEDAIKGMVTEVVRGRVQVLEFKDYKTFYFDIPLPLRVGDEVRLLKIGRSAYLLATPMEE